MPKGFNLRCAAGKSARVWLQGRTLQGLCLYFVTIPSRPRCLRSNHIELYSKLLSIY